MQFLSIQKLNYERVIEPETIVISKIAIKVRKINGETWCCRSIRW